MTARLATHSEVAHRTSDVIHRLVAAGVDVESVEEGTIYGHAAVDPLQRVRESTLDLALVGIRALRGSAADDLTTVAVLPRGDARDVFVTLSGEPTPMAKFRTGARVGLSSMRNAAFLRAHRPGLEPVMLDRELLRRVGEGTGDVLDLSLDAAVMSGLEAGQAPFDDSTVEALEPKAWLPEPGQGALAIVARDPIAEATALDHLPTRTALRAELALLDALDAADEAPVGCFAQPSGRWIRLWAAAVSDDGRRLVRSDLTGPLDEPEALGSAVACQLEARGIEFVLTGSTK